MKNRCSWCNLKNPLYVAYHDQEWGVLNLEENHLFELLILESFQAGLSWECILNKRGSFRIAYEGFDPNRVASFDEGKIQSLMNYSGIVRNQYKILASVENAKVFLEIEKEFHSFREYLLSFTKGAVFYETGNTTSPLSDAISSDLKKRGMRFLGSIIIYSYLQAIGIINSHEEGCFLYKKREPLSVFCFIHSIGA